MDLSEAIRYVLDGDAVIIMGAGASYGAKNQYGEFPSGSRLAKDLYALCGINPDDENDLADASQIYSEKFSEMQLINEIRDRLNCCYFSEQHAIIYSQNWMRYYTTNYDDVALFAAKSKGKVIIPVTLSDKIQDYLSEENICVHINGHIGKLSVDTLRSEFKLTSNSYLSEENIQNSPWGVLLSDDLSAAKCIVIMGLSLKSDLDLGRILRNEELQKKTIIIDSPSLSSNSEMRLSRFGTLYKIGVDGFANEITKISDGYSPRTVEPSSFEYTCFEYKHSRISAIEKAVPSDVFNLFCSGKYCNPLFHLSEGKYDSFIFRYQTPKIRNDIISGKKYIILHSDMGNGKTGCVNELTQWLIKKKYHVFTLKNDNMSIISKEILNICAIDDKCAVIIENYINYFDILKTFSVRDCKNIQFIFTVRSAINFNKLPVLFELFSVREGESSCHNLNKLTSGEIEQCISLFDRYGLWGKNSKLTRKNKKKLLTSRDHGNSRLQSILLDILDSADLRKRIEELSQKVLDDSKVYIDGIVLILISQIMNLRININDIESILSQDIINDAKFRSNDAVKEFFDFSDSNDYIKIKSPVTCKIILQEIATPEKIIKVLCSLANFATHYTDFEKYSTLLIDILSYSHIFSIIHGYNNVNEVLSRYFDSLSEIEYYKRNNFFWLQYAISCMEISEYDRAQLYLRNAYGFAPEDFVPFQINNQQARLYLKKIIAKQSASPLSDFKEAHRLLMLPIVSEKDNEFNVVKLFGYYIRKDFRTAMNTDELKQMHELNCKDAYNRTEAFIRNHPEYYVELNDLSKRLYSAAFD